MYEIIQELQGYAFLERRLWPTALAVALTCRRATKGDEIKFATVAQSSAAPPLPLAQRAQGLAEALPALSRLQGSTAGA